jgi:hypothetical protein
LVHNTGGCGNIFELFTTEQINALTPLINQAVSKIKARSIINTFKDIAQSDKALAKLLDGGLCQIGDLVELPARDFFRRQLTANKDVFFNVELLLFDASGNRVQGTIREIDALVFDNTNRQIEKGLTMKLDEKKVRQGIGADKMSLDILYQLPNEGSALRDFINSKGLLNPAQTSAVARAEIRYLKLSDNTLARVSPTDFKSFLGTRSNFYDFLVEGVTPLTLGVTKEALLNGALELIRRQL